MAGGGHDNRVVPGPAEPLVIRQENPADHAAIRRVVAAAFGSEGEAHLVELIRASGEYRPETALVAASDGDIVGHVMVSDAVIRGAGGERTISILSPLAVRPDRQGQGVGSALVRAVLSIAERRGDPAVVVEGSPAYYRRFGFEPASRHGISLPLPAWAPPEAAQVLRLPGFASCNPLLQGWVVYPKAFEVVE
jgi:putative acetyltransferase